VHVFGACDLHYSDLTVAGVHPFFRGERTWYSVLRPPGSEEDSGGASPPPPGPPEEARPPVDPQAGPPPPVGVAAPDGDPTPRFVAVTVFPGQDASPAAPSCSEDEA
jgi:hypothetical protein